MNWIFVWVLTSFGFEPFFQKVLEGNELAARKLALEQIFAAKTVAEKKIFLQTLYSLRGQLITESLYSAELIRLKDPTCRNEAGGRVVCAPFAEYEVAVFRGAGVEELQLLREGEVNFSYRPKKRSRLDSALVYLGDTLHGINVAGSDLSYFIIRETEYLRERGDENVLRQTLSYFKVSGAGFCKMGEVDATAPDNHYIEMVTMIKVLGDLYECGSPHINF